MASEYVRLWTVVTACVTLAAFSGACEGGTADDQRQSVSLPPQDSLETAREIHASVSGDVAPGTFSGLANNTANQAITGLTFANTVVSFEALLNVRISATANTFTTVKVFGTNKGTWGATSNISAEVSGDAIPGLAFGISSGGTVTISVGSVTGFTSGLVKYRAISLS